MNSGVSSYRSSTTMLEIANHEETGNHQLAITSHISIHVRKTNAGNWQLELILRRKRRCENLLDAKTHNRTAVKNIAVTTKPGPKQLGPLHPVKKTAPGRKAK